jgi:co-chaperonin GroES (HSP10)
MGVMKMEHTRDPKDDIFENVKDYIDDVKITGAQVLVGVYVRPSRTAGGIELPDSYRDEDIYQGKAGVILKMGPLPFNQNDDDFFGGKFPKVGDWVVYRPSDGFPLQLENKQNCRLLSDRFKIKAIVPRPDLVW